MTVDDIPGMVNECINIDPELVEVYKKRLDRDIKLNKEYEAAKDKFYKTYEAFVSASNGNASIKFILKNLESKIKLFSERYDGDQSGIFELRLDKQNHADIFIGFDAWVHDVKPFKSSYFYLHFFESREGYLGLRIDDLSRFQMKLEQLNVKNIIDDYKSGGSIFR
jgi:hypothetical protein